MASNLKDASLKKLWLKFAIYSYVKRLPCVTNSQGKNCFIFLAADYGNLGDVAITYAQKQYLQKIFSDYEVIEVPAAATLSVIRSIKKHIRPDAIVTVVGGGNMGDMYGDIELLRLMVVKTFRKNRVILFPQTIDYSDSPDARWLKRLSQKIYSSHPNLLMMAREKTSYETMRKLYPSVDVRLTPDIVMTLDERKDSSRENIVTLCLRDDKEKTDNHQQIEHILAECNRLGLEQEIYDTHIGGNRYSEAEKYAELEKIWNQFRRSRLIVTDRLHGMIFAYITGTPAIVLPNSNFKIEGCYEWIKGCGYNQLIGKDSQDCNIEHLLTAATKHTITNNPLETLF